VLQPCGRAPELPIFLLGVNGSESVFLILSK
jgi:hypothetical protein